MQANSRTKITATREFYSVGTTFFLAIAFGAMLTKWLDNDLVYYVGSGVAMTLGIIQYKKFDRAPIAHDRAEHLDALRFRALQAGEEFLVIEDVRRLRDEGRKIEAIKLYRQLHPEADLRAALDAVDLM